MAHQSWQAKKWVDWYDAAPESKPDRYPLYCSSPSPVHKSGTIRGMQLYQICVTNIFYYFKYSSNRVSQLKAIQYILDSPK